MDKPGSPYIPFTADFMNYYKAPESLFPEDIQSGTAQSESDQYLIIFRDLLKLLLKTLTI